MLAPKKVKWRKMQKGRRKGTAAAKLSLPTQVRDRHAGGAS